MNIQTTMNGMTETNSASDAKRAAAPGDVVHVQFVGRLDDGTVFDSSSRLGPLEFTLGEGDVIPGVDEAVKGLSVGEKLTTHVPPVKGFGPRRDDLLVTVPADRYPGENPSPGDYFELKGAADRPVRVQVVEVLPDSLKVDANHPLAGHPLTFDLQLLKIA